jgi:hypothetical protein
LLSAGYWTKELEILGFLWNGIRFWKFLYFSMKKDQCQFIKEKELRDMLRQTCIPWEGNHILGRECRVILVPHRQFVVKLENPDNPFGFKRTLAGYRTSMAHLGGIIPCTSIVKNLDMNNFGQWYPEAFTAEQAIIQERKIPYDCLVKNINLVTIDAEELGRRLAKVDIVLQKRGCYRTETKFCDYGVGLPDYKASLLDLGCVIRQEAGKPLEHFIPIIRGYQLYERYWELQKKSPEIFIGYLEESKLDFKDLDSNIFEQDKIKFRESWKKKITRIPAKDVFLKAARDKKKSPALQRAIVLCEKYETEFVRLAEQEREMYFDKEALGIPAEPLLTI